MLLNECENEGPMQQRLKKPSKPEKDFRQNLAGLGSDGIFRLTAFGMKKNIAPNKLKSLPSMKMTIGLQLQFW